MNLLQFYWISTLQKVFCRQQTHQEGLKTLELWEVNRIQNRIVNFSTFPTTGFKAKNVEIKIFHFQTFLNLFHIFLFAGRWNCLRFVVVQALFVFKS